jgi:hypothetical protein
MAGLLPEADLITCLISVGNDIGSRRHDISADKGYLNGSLYARLQDNKLAHRTVSNRNFV